MKGLNDSLAGAVARVGASVVRVESGRRATSGISWGDGLVVTAAHGVHEGHDVAVIDGEGARFSAELVGRDRGTDVALLRATGLAAPAPTWRAVDGLEVGHLALALGRPGRSVRASLRIVGVLGPEVATPCGGRLDRYVETDRGLPDGFAGGPLVDVDGAVIGLDTDGLFRGADLAIPRVTVERVVQAILDHGGVERGYLGVGVRPVGLPASTAAELGRERGALVVAVEPGGPADKAALHLGDVLVDVDGEPVTGPRSLVAALRERARQTVPVRILRTGALTSISVEIGART